MKPTPRSVVALTATLLFTATLFPGCSGPQEDVHISYCKELIEARVGSAQTIEWKGSESEIRRPEYAKISLTFDAAASPMEAACYYKYDTADESVMTHSNPLSAYATVPYRMTVNGQEVEERILHEAIQEAARRQGRALVEGVKKGVDDAVRAVKEQTR